MITQLAKATRQHKRVGGERVSGIRQSLKRGRDGGWGWRVDMDNLGEGGLHKTGGLETL